MRKIMFVCVAVVAAVIIGCSASKNFTFSIDKVFVVNNYSSTSYTSSDTINATQESSDFNTYKSDLQSVSIQSATYTITSFTGPLTQTITSATVTVKALDGSSSKVLATLSNVNLSSVAAITQPLTLTDDGKQFFENQLTGSTSSVVITFTATANQAPVNFTVKFHFDILTNYSKSLI